MSRPVTYWDPSQGGEIFSMFEVGLDLAVIGYFAWVWLALRRSRPRLSLVSR